MFRRSKNIFCELENNEQVIIKQSDKCKGLVIMDKSDYVDKSNAILNDQENYNILGKNPVPCTKGRSRNEKDFQICV